MGNVIPPPQYGLHNSKYDFSALKKYGDSIFIETKKLHHVRDAAYKYGNYHGIKIVTRKEEKGVRVYHAGVAHANQD